MENPDPGKIKHGGTISALTRAGCAVITSAVRSETRGKAAARQRSHVTTDNRSVKSLHTCLDDFVKHWLTAPLREAFKELGREHLRVTASRMDDAAGQLATDP